jgi:putative nucleotidyltransferase with HDIG domain
MANTASSAIENARLFAETERRLQYVQALHGIDQAITASLDLRVALEVVLDHVMTQLHVDAATVLLYNAPLQTLEFAAERGLRTRGLERRRLRLGEGPTGRAALERQFVIVNEAPAPDEPSAWTKLLADEDVRAYCAVPLLAKGEVQGVLNIFQRGGLAPDREWLDFLQTLAGEAAIAIDNARLFQGLQRSNLELALAYDATIEGWSRALDMRDKETEGHTQRVTELTEQLARAMGLSRSELVHIRRGSLLHDIGKMAIPDHILLKPGPLTSDEWVIMRQHPVYAFEMLLPINYLRPALDIPYCHHEKWDGSGYPRGLVAEQIPLAARLFAVVDVWDALRSDRPYRPAWPAERVRAHMREQSGKHFDPRALECFETLDL